MTVKKTIDGLYAIIGRMLFNSLTNEGKIPKELDGDDEKTYDACMSAIELLKAKEPHIVTTADYENNPNVDEEGNLAVWRESRHWNGIAYHKDGWVILNKNRVEGWFNSDVIRFWTYKPTKAQMEAVKWE